MKNQDTSTKLLFDEPGPRGRRRIRILNWVAIVLIALFAVSILMRLHNPPQGENQLSWQLWQPALELEAWTDFYLPGSGPYFGRFGYRYYWLAYFWLVLWCAALVAKRYFALHRRSDR